jgi:hypothetical protein
VLLDPDDLRSDFESAGFEPARNLAGVNARVSEVYDVTGKQRPGRRPLDPIVVGDLAALTRPRVETGLLAPLRFELDAIRRIGHHENRRLLFRQQARRILGGCGVAAQEAMLSTFARLQEP